MEIEVAAMRGPAGHDVPMRVILGHAKYILLETQFSLEFECLKTWLFASPCALELSS